MTERLQHILSELRHRLGEFYGERLLRVVLFGSQARGDAEEGSDIDIVVVLEGAVNPGEEIARTGGIIADLSLRYDVVVSCIFMDGDSYRTRNGPLLRNVRQEGVVL